METVAATMAASTPAGGRPPSRVGQDGRARREYRTAWMVDTGGKNAVAFPN